MIALTVSLEVYADKIEEFLSAIEQNAKSTFNDEPGCRYFDVTQDINNPEHFVFYELYDDEAAIAAHRAAPHFAQWRKAADVCVVKGSQVNTFSRRIFHHQ
ncbi:putative quinol monooxygenase [Serratia marcescens]|uniref:putative quinol monooxygenase n=1 Tax=Serratia marcescens TaxID=615 RepID=UPI003515CC42